MKIKTTKLALSAIISTALLGLSATSALAHLEPRKGDEMEKCYGVVKAGENDCSSKVNKHGCAGMAKTDANSNEWLKLPKGLCKRLVGSSLAEGDKGSEDDKSQQ